MFDKNQKFSCYNGKLNGRAKEMRKEMTSAERKLWYDYLRGHQYRFVRQKVVDNFIIDFYCQKLKLGIEVDGTTHLGVDNETYDESRTQNLEMKEIEIIRFWNDEIFSGFEQVVNIIEIKIKALLRKEG